MGFMVQNFFLAPVFAIIRLFMFASEYSRTLSSS
jgi:hypothetical protein